MTALAFEWKAIRRQRRAKAPNQHAANRAIIKRACIPYIDRGEVLHFREFGKPQADFYPGTGKWIVDGQTNRGGAAAFLMWYEVQ